jgi:hypothetical protein
MNSKQSSIYAMQRRVYDLLKKNLALLSELPMFTSLFGKYETLLNQIWALSEQQEKDISGLKQQKETLKADLIKKALDVSRRVVAYATLAGNEVLSKEAYYTETGLQHSTNELVVTSCSVIYSAAVNNAAALVEYGVTADTLTALKAAIDGFKGIMDTPKKGYIEKKQTTDQLAQLLEDEASLLGKIDLLVDMQKNTHPEFYAEYYDTRKVVYYSGTLAAKCQVTDAVSGEGLSGVNVSFAIEGVVKLEKITADGGGFIVKTLDDGTYTVTASRFDYVSQTLTVNVLADELCVINIAMVKK